MSEHSLLSPSSAHRWLECPGSVALCQGIENTSSPEADEGTRAHTVAEYILLSGAGRYDIPERYSNPNFDESMREPLNTYLGTLRSMSEGAVSTHVEMKVDLSKVLGVPDEKGTADFVAVFPHEIQVHDLKYGVGVAVSAEENPQLMLYALGVLDTLKMDTVPSNKVRLVIHQPRLKSVSEWVTTVGDLHKFRDFARVKAQEAAMLVNIGGVSLSCLHPGPKQCKWCLVSGNCEAETNHNLKLILGDFEDITEDLPEKIEESIKEIQNMEYDKLASVYLSLDMITKWVKNLRQHTLECLLLGEEIPGLKVVEGKRGPRKWGEEALAAEILKKSKLKLDEIFVKKLITPPVAEKRLKKHPRTWKKLVETITQSDPQPVVVPVSDKRPAISVSPVVDDFKEDDCSDLL